MADSAILTMPKEAGRMGSIALDFQYSRKHLDAHVECSPVDIDKLWCSLCLNNGLDPGDEGIGHGNDDIAIADRRAIQCFGYRRRFSLPLRIRALTFGKTP